MTHPHGDIGGLDHSEQPSGEGFVGEHQLDDPGPGPGAVGGPISPELVAYAKRAMAQTPEEQARGWQQRAEAAEREVARLRDEARDEWRRTARAVAEARKRWEAKR